MVSSGYWALPTSFIREWHLAYLWPAPVSREEQRHWQKLSELTEPSESRAYIQQEVQADLWHITGFQAVQGNRWRTWLRMEIWMGGKYWQRFWAYLMFVIFFTRTHLESWKFYTRKVRKFATKVPRDKTAQITADIYFKFYTEFNITHWV